MHNKMPFASLIATLLAALLAFGSAACSVGSDETPDAESGAATEAATEETAEAPGEETPAEDDGNRPTEGVRGGRDVARETLVVVEPLSRGPVRNEVVVSARVETRISVQVFPKLAGLPITEVLVEEGDRVEAGDLLMKLYDTELRLAEQRARANRDQARKQAEQNELTIESEDRRVLRARRQAEKAGEDLERLTGLGELATRKEVEDARVAAETAEDDLSLAEYSQRAAKIALELAAIDAKRAEIDWEAARTNLEQTGVRAPVRGVIAERHCDVGELSSMGQNAFRISDVDDLVLNLRVPQDALGLLVVGQNVEVQSVTDADAEFHGVVRVVNPVLDLDSGSVRAIVDLDPAAGLVPGLFCEAHIITSARDEALLVSKRAVLYEDDQPIIFAANGEDSAKKIAFVAGVSTATSVEILSDLSGAPLPSDLRIIVVGQENLKDGAPIRIVEDAF